MFTPLRNNLKRKCADYSSTKTPTKSQKPLIPLFGGGSINKGNDSDSGSDDSGHLPSLPNLFGGADAVDVYTSHNHIYFKTDVTEESIDKLCREIDNLNHKLKNIAKKTTYGTFTPNPIYLHITTNGGSLLAGFLGYDKIKDSSIPIYTIIEGCVASAGSLLSIAGKQRYMTPNSYLLIHQLRSFIAGTFENIIDDAKNCTTFMNKMVNIYHKHCNGVVSKTRIRKILKHDLFWSYDETLKNGFVDGCWPQPLPSND